MIASILIFASSLLIVAFSIKPLITIAIKKRLFDAPSELRKIHKRIVPNLGGLAIFTSFLLSTSLFMDGTLVPNSNYLLASGIIIFITGLKDDIIGVDPLKKFIAQFAAAFIVTILGDVRILSLEGLFGIHELAYPFSIGLSVFAIVGIINAYNLVDGIDGLAGCLGVMTSIVYAYLFYSADYDQWSYMCLALAGSLVGFLIHNVSPAKIFMGDCGSLMLGFLIAVLSIQFMNIAGEKVVSLDSLSITSASALVLSIVALPVFDTLRVFTIRIVNNQSPFKADRNHMHHRMLALGLNHMQATAVLLTISLLFIGIAFALQGIGNNQLFATLVLVILAGNTGLSIYLYSRKLLEEGKSTGAVGANGKSASRNTDPSEVTPEGKVFAEKILKKVSSKFDSQKI